MNLVFSVVQHLLIVLLYLYSQSPKFPFVSFSFILVDKLELFHNVYEGYKLHQMCESKEFKDCDNPAAQILCEKCQYMSKGNINVQIW